MGNKNQKRKNRWKVTEIKKSLTHLISIKIMDVSFALPQME